MIRMNHRKLLAFLITPVLATSVVHQEANATSYEPVQRNIVTEVTPPLVRNNAYLRLNGGYRFKKDADYTEKITGPAGSITTEENKWKDIESGYTFGGAIGYNFDQFAVELGVDYNRLEDGNLDSGVVDAMKMRSTAFILSGQYRTPGLSTMGARLFAGLGLGFAYNGLQVNMGSLTKYPMTYKTAFSWRGEAGILIPVGERADLSLSYRYTNLGKFTTSVKNPLNNNNEFTMKNVSTNSILLGLAFNF